MIFSQLLQWNCIISQQTALSNEKKNEKIILQNENGENSPILNKYNIHLISLNDTDKAILISVTANAIKNISKKAWIVMFGKKVRCPYHSFEGRGNVNQ